MLLSMLVSLEVKSKINGANIGIIPIPFSDTLCTTYSSYGTFHNGLETSSESGFITLTPNDVAPNLTSSSPADGASNVTLSQSLTLTFDSNMMVGSGNITIVETGVGNFEQLDVTNGALVSISGAIVTLNLSGTLSKGTDYHILIDASALVDDMANSFAGIADPTTLNFTTVDVVINEVVTDPQTDWSSNGFDGSDGLGTVSSGVDEFVELYINSADIDFTGWTIELNDGTNVTGDLTNTGAFDVVNYFSDGTGTFLSSEAGDYLVLGNLDGSGAMNNDVQVVLKDPGGAIIDQVQLGSGAGEAPSGNATDALDESIQRIPNGTDTDADDADFVQGPATLGKANDMASPIIQSTSPLDDATGVITRELTVTFNENVVLGSGRLGVFDASDDSEYDIIGAGSGRISVLNNIVTIDLVKPLPLGKDFYVKMSPRLFSNGSGDIAGAILDKTTWNFTTDSAPVISGTSPVDDAENVISTTLTISFSEDITADKGRISVKRVSDDVEVFGTGVSNANRVTVNSNTATITMPRSLSGGTQYYVEVPAVAFKDVNNNYVMGILDKTTWNFTTDKAPELTSLSPIDGILNFSGTTLTMTFDEDVIADKGRISIRNVSGDGEVTGIGVSSDRVSVINNVVTVDLVNPLPLDMEVYVLVPGSAFKDANGIYFEGILDNTVWNIAGETAVSIESRNPVQDGLAETNVLSLTFDRIVQAGKGRIRIFDSVDDIEVFSTGVSNTGSVNFSDETMTITVPLGRLLDGHSYYVKIPGSAIVDGDINRFAGMSTDSDWRFTKSSGSGEGVAFSGEPLGRRLSEVLRLYPNPAQTKLTLDGLKEFGDKLQVQIIDMIGSKVYYANEIEGDSHTVDVTSYSNGVYIATVVTSSGQMIHKKFSVKK
jgi:methionine-rich copper-binding protein CopC